MGTLEDQLDPRERAKADAEKAAEEAGQAASLNQNAANLNSISTSLTQMGFGEAGGVLGREATREIVDASYDAAQARRLSAASDAWTTVADDLDQGAKARGEAYVAGAGHTQAEAALQHQLSATERTDAEVAYAATGAIQTALNQRADELGHEADAAARTALEDEAAARDIGGG